MIKKKIFLKLLQGGHFIQPKPTNVSKIWMKKQKVRPVVTATGFKKFMLRLNWASNNQNHFAIVNE